MFKILVHMVCSVLRNASVNSGGLCRLSQLRTTLTCTCLAVMMHSSVSSSPSRNNGLSVDFNEFELEELKALNKIVFPTAD